MIEYISKLDTIKSYVKNKDFLNMKPLLDSAVWEREFYDIQIADDESWFDVLSGAKVFNFKDFPEEVEEKGQTYKVMWGPFYYLNKIFTKIPTKVIPIFAEITQKHITNENFNYSWYVSQIIQLVSENLSKLSLKDIKRVIEPLQINCKQKGSFYVTDALLNILEYLIDKGEENFVSEVLTGLLGINAKFEDKKVEFFSWRDYPYLIKRIDDLGFFKKYQKLSLTVFTNILRNAYSAFSQRYKSDGFSIDYILNQDIHYCENDLVVVRQLASFAQKVSQEDLDYLYDTLLPLKNHQIIKNVLCYVAAQNENNTEHAYKLLLEFANELSSTGFGASDYDILAMKVFGKLKNDQKEAILNKRNAAYMRELSQHNNSEDAEIQARIIRWFFVPFKDNLPQKWQDKYGEALKDVDAEQYIKRTRFEFHEINENTSTLSDEDLKDKSLSDLITIIRNMSEKKEILFRERWNIEGTTKLIAQHINNSKDLLKDCHILEDSTILLGVHNEILWNISFGEKTVLETAQIKPLIRYLSWVSDLPEKPEGTVRRDIYSIENSSSLWMATNRVINNMLLNVSGFDEDDYLDILRILFNNLSKDDELAHRTEVRKDYYSTAINSLLGTAMTALIRLGLKVSDLTNNEILTQISNKIFELLSQKNVLIYSILGRYYPWLQYVVGEKLAELRRILFDKNNKELFTVSFGTYLNNSLYFALFDELKEYYLYATQSNAFIENDKLIYMGDALGDHLGILLYKNKITTDDDLGKVLLNSPQLLHRAVWWIISSLVHEKIEDLSFSEVKNILDLILAELTDQNLFQHNKYNGVFDSFTMLLESKYFKEDEKWMINTAEFLFRNELISYNFYNNEVYKNLTESAQNVDLCGDIIDFLNSYLIKTKYEDKYSPISSNCPYNFDSEPINRIFETLLNETLTASQKDKLYNIFNTLSNYGFYHRVEKFIEQIKEEQ